MSRGKAARREAPRAARRKSAAQKLPVPVYARPGMAVSLYSDQGDGVGVIEGVAAAYCVVRTPAGKLAAMGWAEVELANVRPDPKFIGRADARGGRRK
jgi:hypothetical protein